MNSIIFRPAPACAHHARKKFSHCLLLWVVGLVIASLLTFSEQAIGASDGFNPDPGSPSIAASLSGVVFYDANHNGQLDPGEYAIGGGNMELFSGSTLIQTTTVSSTGQYSFSDLDAGTYTLYNPTAGDWLAVPGIILAMDQSTSPSSATGSDSYMYNVVLNGGDTGEIFNYAAQYYPIQLLSKRMLLASSQTTQPLVQAVPEPATALMLSFAAIPFMVMAAMRRYRKK